MSQHRARAAMPMRCRRLDRTGTDGRDRFAPAPAASAPTWHRPVPTAPPWRRMRAPPSTREMDRSRDSTRASPVAQQFDDEEPVLEFPGDSRARRLGDRVCDRAGRGRRAGDHGQRVDSIVQHRSVPHPDLRAKADGLATGEGRLSFWTRLLRGATGDQYHRGIRLFNEGNYDEAVARARGSSLTRAREPVRTARRVLRRRGPRQTRARPFSPRRAGQARATTSNRALRESPLSRPVLLSGRGRTPRRQPRRGHRAPRTAVELNPEYAEASCLWARAVRRGLLRQRGGNVRPSTRAGAPHPHPLSNVSGRATGLARASISPALQELREVVADAGDASRDAVREATNAFNVGDYERAVALFRTRRRDAPRLRRPARAAGALAHGGG